MSFELILPFLRPIEPLLLDESISEIMGNPDASWWYERDGIIHREKTISFSAGKLRTGLEVIANQLGKRLDEDNPILHAQLPDGSRLAAVIPPVVRLTPALIIRKRLSTNVNLLAPMHLRELTVYGVYVRRRTRMGNLNDGKSDRIQTNNRWLQTPACPEPHPVGAFHGERVCGT